MSLPLRDFRGKISVEAEIALKAEAHATGRDQSEVARDVLHRWALEKINAAKIVNNLLAVEGLMREDKG